MRTYKQKLVKTTDDVLCDVCGKSTTKFSYVGPDFATIDATWGYGSIDDGVQYEIHMCEECFVEVLDFIKTKRKNILGPFNYPHKYDPLDGKSYL